MLAIRDRGHLPAIDRKTQVIRSGSDRGGRALHQDESFPGNSHQKLTEKSLHVVV